MYDICCEHEGCNVLIILYYISGRHCWTATWRHNPTRATYRHTVGYLYNSSYYSKSLIQCRCLVKKVNFYFKPLSSVMLQVWPIFVQHLRLVTIQDDCFCEWLNNFTDCLFFIYIKDDVCMMGSVLHYGSIYSKPGFVPVSLAVDLALVVCRTPHMPLVVER